MKTLYQNLKWQLDVARYEKLDKNWRTENFPINYRIVPYCRIYLPIKGEAFIAHGNKEYHLRPGYIFLVPSLIKTISRCEDYCELLWSNFNVRNDFSSIDLFSIIRPQYELKVDNMHLATLLFEIMAKYCSNPLRESNVISDNEILQSTAALQLLVSPFFKSAEMNNQKIEKFSELTELLNYIESNVGNNLDLKKIAEHLHKNPTYLTNSFAKHMGMPLMHYYYNRKLDLAVNLLISSDLRVGEIAYKVGFDNPNNFSRFFKNRFKISPLEFRRNTKV